jgi:hypothetical protein
MADKVAQKEQLGIKVGEQLPSRGRCAHYSKSYRWFRYGPARTPCSNAEC